jgi:RHS repeat-associated protein
MLTAAKEEKFSACTDPCVFFPLAAAGVYPKTRVWGSSEKTLHCFSATAPLSGNSRRGCEESSGKTTVGSALDSNGNTATKVDSTGTTTYAWDFENRLTSVTPPGSGGTVSFAYDPFGRRIKKVTSTITSVFAYDGDNLVEETNASGVVVARYEDTQNIDEPLAMLRSSATSYFHADGLGSITSLSNSAGSIANTYTYDSFGKLTASTGSLVNPFRYTARESDTETGLYYYRARYYDPMAGRFASEDPLGFNGGDANFFRIVQNRSTMFTDPFGLLAIDPSFNANCLPALKQALDIVRKIALTNKTCDCAYKTIPEGSGRSLSSFLDDPSIKISYAPDFPPTKDAHGNISITTANVNPFNTHQIVIRAYSCRMGRWTLAADLVHELVHISKGSLPGDDEQLPADMEILCGTTKPQLNFRR